jgi:hypothetical protein
MRHDLRAMLAELAEPAESPGASPDLRHRVFGQNRLGWDPADLDELLRVGLERFVADHEDAPHASGWDIALRGFPHGFTDTVATLDRLGRAELVAELSNRIRDAGVVDVPERLSDWDAQLCAQRGWDPLDEAGFPPLDSLHIAVAIGIARAAVEWFAASAPLAAQRSLHRAAMRKLEELDVWMPEPLSPLGLASGVHGNDG